MGGTDGSLSRNSVFIETEVTEALLRAVKCCLRRDDNNIE